MSMCGGQSCCSWRDSLRRRASPMVSRRPSIATSLIRRISRQRAPGLACSSTQSRFTAIFPATPTWPSPRPGFLDINYRTTSSFPTLPGTFRISGGAGTLVSQVGCVIISTFHSAEIVGRADLLTVTS